MKTIRIASLALALALSAPIAVFAACSSDTTSTGGPANKQPDVPPGSSSGASGMASGSSGMSSGSSGSSGHPSSCDEGVAFDNTRIPGWPNVPQP